MDQKFKDAGFTEQRFNTGEINLNYVAGPNYRPALVPHAQYKKILGANHVMHMFKPTEFVEAVEVFAAQIGVQAQPVP